MHSRENGVVVDILVGKTVLTSCQATREKAAKSSSWKTEPQKHKEAIKNTFHSFIFNNKVLLVNVGTKTPDVLSLIQSSHLEFIIS